MVILLTHSAGPYENIGGNTLKQTENVLRSNHPRHFASWPGTQCDHNENKCTVDGSPIHIEERQE